MGNSLSIGTGHPAIARPGAEVKRSAAGAFALWPGVIDFAGSLR
jgi:hypothetical protein